MRDPFASFSASSIVILTTGEEGNKPSNHLDGLSPQVLLTASKAKDCNESVFQRYFSFVTKLIDK